MKRRDARRVACPVMAVAVAILALSAVCARGQDPQQNPPRLKDVFAKDFRVGVAFGEALLDSSNTVALALATSQFNAFTPENAMKWSRIHPEEGRYEFAPADALVAFAEEHHMTVTGHTLVWNRQTPAWVFGDEPGVPASRETVLLRLREHMRTVMGHYRGRVRGWDVVNEAVGGENEGELRDSPWRRALGDDYVETAFRLAREADPDAALYYNDYSLEEPWKREKAVKLIRHLKERGVPIDGIGLQGHFTLQSVNPAEMAKTIETFAAMGLRVNISELDMRLYAYGDLENRYPSGAPPDLLKEQAEKYAELFEVLVAHRDVIDRVTFWGVNDGLSWTNNDPVPGRPDYPLLFDRASQPKPAFYAVVGVPQP